LARDDGAGYTGVEKRTEHAGRSVVWQIAPQRNTDKQLSTKAQYAPRTPFRIDQAPIRLHQGALPRPNHEHGAVGHVVRAVKICEWLAGSGGAPVTQEIASPERTQRRKVMKHPPIDLILIICEESYSEK